MAHGAGALVAAALADTVDDMVDLRVDGDEAATNSELADAKGPAAEKVYPAGVRSVRHQRLHDLAYSDEGNRLVAMHIEGLMSLQDINQAANVPIRDLESIFRERECLTPIRKLRQMRLQRDANAIRPEIRASLLHTRDADDSAAELRVDVKVIRTALSDDVVPDYRVLLSSPRSATRRYSADEMKEQLVEAAGLVSGVLRGSDYDQFLADHPALPDGRATPSRQIIMIRLGGWNSALGLAGLPANPTSGAKRQHEEGSTLEAVIACWNQLGTPPTASAYERWSKERPGVPSGATVRNRHGTWQSVMIQCWQIKYEIVLEQDDDVALPPHILTEIEQAADDTPHDFVEYERVDESFGLQASEMPGTDRLAALERAVKSHKALQNLISAHGREAGLTPMSPTAATPLFDLLFLIVGRRVILVEVKSAVDANLELQMRLGLGQVLRYKSQLERLGYEVIPSIAIELEPDREWRELLREMEVELIVQSTAPVDLAAIIKRVTVS